MLTLGRYELLGEIASGGTATVHFGRLRGASGFSRTVAIKRLHPQLAADPEVVTMFTDEARLASRIRHPNVVPVLDVVAQDDELFLVMAYVEGEPLSRLVYAPSGAAPVPPDIASAIFAGALGGLHAAHEATDESGRAMQLVHRDVSPQNILVGADGLAHLLDFGIAKAVGRSHMTRDGTVRGKLAYMAPEQVLGESVTRLADVYAASVALWEALTGARLFQAESDAELVVQVLNEPIKPPSALVPSVPAALDAVVMRGLDRERTRRFADARAMAAALDAAVRGAPAERVAAWVHERAGDALAARAQALVDAQREARPPARRGRALAVGAACVLAGAAALAAALVPARGAPRGETRARSDARKELVVARTEAIVASTAVVASPTALAAPAAQPAAPRAASARPARPADAESCDPPYTLEGSRKVFKRKCL